MRELSPRVFVSFREIFFYFNISAMSNFRFNKTAFLKSSTVVEERSARDLYDPKTVAPLATYVTEIVNNFDDVRMELGLNASGIGGVKLSANGRACLYCSFLNKGQRLSTKFVLSQGLTAKVVALLGDKDYYADFVPADGVPTASNQAWRDAASVLSTTFAGRFVEEDGTVRDTLSLFAK